MGTEYTDVTVLKIKGKHGLQIKCFHNVFIISIFMDVTMNSYVYTVCIIVGNEKARSNTNEELNKYLFIYFSYLLLIYY